MSDAEFWSALSSSHSTSSISAPKVERLDDNSCEVTWEALSPMKGDPVIYTLQCMMGNSEFKQVLAFLLFSTAF